VRSGITLGVAIAAVLSQIQSDSVYGKGISGPEPLLTPETMLKYGFSIRCRFIEETITEGSLPTRPTGVLDVDVVFDAEKGPTIKRIDRVVLVVRDGEKGLLAVPVQTSSHPSGRGVTGLGFSVHKDWLSKTTLTLVHTGEGRRGAYFHVDISAFYKTNSIRTSDAKKGTPTTVAESRPGSSGVARGAQLILSRPR